MRSIIITVRKALEFNTTLIYRWAFLGEVADAIERTGHWTVDVFDGAVFDSSLDEYIEVIRRNYDLCLILSDPHTAPEAKQIAHFFKAISPKTKLFVYGRATVFMPQFFCRHPFDAVHISGDRELIAKDFAEWVYGTMDVKHLTGVWISGVHSSASEVPAGRQLSDGNWFFPLLSKLPLESYKQHYASKKRVFEYAITVSKGCPHLCPYCETWKDQGRHDRRREISEVVSWITSAIKDDAPWVVQFWSSNFFHDRRWVESLCKLYVQSASTFKWRAVGSFRDIDSHLIQLAAAAGCHEIAVGVETLYHDRSGGLKGANAQLLNVITACKSVGIKIKCLTMVGIPNQTKRDVEFTFTTLRAADVPIRVSLYTPLQELASMTVEKLDTIDLRAYDRRTFVTVPHDLTPEEQISALVEETR